MSSRCAGRAAVLSLCLMVLGPPAMTQTIEENRYASELRACAQLPEADRKPCEDRVHAKINAERRARIEAESNRRTTN